MKTSVLINNCNYAEYVCDAVKSVLNQTLVPSEIIVVDDGSTDDSFDVLSKAFGSEEIVRIVSKENGGQLSAVNTGYQLATGDLIFFLDSDDLYKQTYIEKVVAFYESNSECDFLYCALEEFGLSDQIVCDYEYDKDLGFSVVAGILDGAWNDARTSSLSMQKGMMDRFMPIPLESDWRICADVCLDRGTSISGAHKFFLAEPLVRYRVHANNGWYGNNISKHEDYLHKTKTNILIEFLVNRFGYNRFALEDLILSEFNSTRDARTRKDFQKYRKVIKKSSRGWAWHLSQQRKLKRAYKLLRKGSLSTCSGRKG